MRVRTGAYRAHAFATVGNLRASWEQHGALVDAIFKNDPIAQHLSPGNGMRGFADFLASLPKQLLV